MRKKIDIAIKFLIHAQNEDGGWPYQPGRQSSPEPTCFSLLALGGYNPTNGHVAPVQKGLQWALSRLNEKGALTLQNDTEPHWTTSLLVIALKQLHTADESQKKSAQWLLQWKAKPFGKQQEEVALNGGLIGWPWISDTFSWVEPTSQAILALKFCGYGKHERVIEAERLLLDRVCQDGGWNYGNHTVLGTPLHGYAVTTAWAVLAMQNTSGTNALLDKGLAFLEQETRNRPSTLSLSLTILCFDILGKPTSNLARALIRRQAGDGSWRQNIHLTALAVIALQTIEMGTNVFKISSAGKTE